MESEDSQNSSSENESNDEGCQSPVSTKSQGAHSNKSNASRSRSSSPESRVQSASSHHSPNFQEGPNSPNFQEGPNSPADSYHSKNGSHHSDESQHSPVGSPVGSYSQEDRVSVENSNPPDVKDNCTSENQMIDEKHQYSKEENLSDHSPVHSNSSQDSVKCKNNRETGNMKARVVSSPAVENRSRSRSTSLSSDDDDKSSSSMHIPKSTDKNKFKTDSDKQQNSSHDSDKMSKANKSKDNMSDDDDNDSVKSDSSISSRSSRGSGKSVGSANSSSIDSRRSKKSRKKSESSSSESSGNSSHGKGGIKSPDTHAEEISDGDMESDQENDSHRFKEEKCRPELNISHEDLSDVSDLEESIGDHLDNENSEDYSKKDEVSSESKHLVPESKQISIKTKATEEGEEQLDFEAEDGECEIEPVKEKDDAEEKTAAVVEESVKPEENKEAKELEEGEVTDEDDVRPEETEPRPVCRFFSRGQCTWGASCRFLHPGVTDKGNYTMFELIRPVVPGEFGRDERMYAKPEPPLVESAWERGLRTAKEMLRKSVKRKEQDIDFEEKKMNLSLAQEEFDKENGYYGRVPSPEPRYVRHIPSEYPPMARPPPEEYYGRRQIHYEPEFAPMPARERVRPYRELPSHRMPDYYSNKYEEEAPPTSSKRPKPKREVIVQRVEERQGRGDEWSDPWMRSKSPAGRRKESRKRSYSSGSSYSSSSSSRSSSDSSRSTYRSRSSSHRRRRSRSRRSRQVSPSVIVSERKAANERAALMNPPAPKRRVPSPGMMRVSGAANPPAPSKDDLRRSRSKLAAALARVKGRRSSKSSSGSSGSSSSDSDSSDSSSSSSKDESSPRRPAGMEISLAKAMDALKSGGLEKNKIKLNLKNPVGMKKNEGADSRKNDQSQGKKRTASSPPSGDPKAKKATSRREELLKQLKAVEDAIAKKRSKVI